ncbi:MAG TPA: P-loop NTPase fold protein [Candidatus Angelobacter sp.]|jgi:hypothetical protein
MNHFCLSDIPDKHDALGFKPYVVVVSDFLLNKNTIAPITLSVEGEWGSGKTSFMRQLETCIKERSNYVKTVWFSAWRYEKADSLWAAFAINTVDQLAKQTKWANRFKSNLALRFKRFRSSSGPLSQLISILAWTILLSLCIAGSRELFQHPNTGHDALFKTIASGGILGAIFALLRMAKDGMELIGNPLKGAAINASKGPEYQRYFSFIEEFHEDFSRILKSYAGDNRVFVFIDDLDRCELPRAAELIQALNLMISDSLNIVYILGIDREKIAAGLAAKFENLLPYLVSENYKGSNLAFGYAYLEKFLQIPFRLPQPSSSELCRLVNPEAPDRDGLLRDFADQFSIEEADIMMAIRMVSPAFDYNPRRLKQFINCYRLYGALAESLALFREKEEFEEGEGLTPQKLVKLIAINLRWPLFLIQAMADPGLLDSINRSNNNTEDEIKKGVTVAKEYWNTHLALVNLVKYGLPGSDGLEWELLPKDIEIFFRIAPSLAVGSNPKDQPLDSSASIAR